MSLRGGGLRGAGLILAALLTLLGGGCARPEPPVATGLHWFIPDGFRADPTTFNVFQWAEEGKMPHLQALLKRGSYGYSIPAFPSHTPANFATVLTGSTPRVHGVADGPMHVDGHPLDRPAVSGFSSTARKVPAIWSLMEDAGKSVFLLSGPGSTPPELGPGGVTVRGRWGGWGPELPPVIFESASADRVPTRTIRPPPSRPIFPVADAGSPRRLCPIPWTSPGTSAGWDPTEQRVPTRPATWGAGRARRPADQNGMSSRSVSGSSSST